MNRFSLVAGAGFEPHDLRVMSPTSYQTAPPRDIQFALANKIYYSRKKIVCKVFFCYFSNLFNDSFLHFVVFSIFTYFYSSHILLWEVKI